VEASAWDNDLDTQENQEGEEGTLADPPCQAAAAGGSQREVGILGDHRMLVDRVIQVEGVEFHRKNYLRPVAKARASDHDA
jgi:hypothetical protein